MVLFDFKRQKALDVTGNKGVEPAMEWLLAHSDDTEVAPPQATPNVSGANDDAGAAGASAPASASTCSSTSEPTPEVKSFKCEEW